MPKIVGGPQRDFVRLRSIVRASCGWRNFPLPSRTGLEAPAGESARIASSNQEDVVLDVGANSGQMPSSLRRAGFNALPMRPSHRDALPGAN